MPSVQPLPTLADLLQAYRDGVIGQREKRADVHDGSGYDLTNGPAAILWSREAQRDRDLFRSIYFDTAEGDDLTQRGARMYGIPRSLDSYGTGKAIWTRPNASAGQGTIPEGTRIFVLPPSGTADARNYAVAEDTPVGATQLAVPVKVRATTLGAGTAITAIPPSYLLRIDDPLWDTSWIVQSLITTDGTDFEQASDYRARVRATRFANRAGYALSIIQACKDAGAYDVALYTSNWIGDTYDFGLNFVYVADASGSTARDSPLIKACQLALESVRVLGCDLQVCPIFPAPVTVDVTVSLWDDPGSFDLVDITSAVRSAIAAYFDGRANAYTYQLDAIYGAVINASSAIQGATINKPTSSVGVYVLINGVPFMLEALARYTVSQPNIAVYFQGPQ